MPILTTTLIVYGPACLVEHGQRVVQKALRNLLYGEHTVLFDSDRTKGGEVAVRSDSAAVPVVELRFVDRPALSEIKTASAEERDFTFVLDWPNRLGDREVRCRLTFQAGIVSEWGVAEHVAGPGHDAAAESAATRYAPNVELLRSVAECEFLLGVGYRYSAISQGLGNDAKSMMHAGPHLEVYEAVKTLLPPEHKARLYRDEQRHKVQSEVFARRVKAYYETHDALRAFDNAGVNRLLDDGDRDIMARFQAVLEKLDPMEIPWPS